MNQFERARDLRQLRFMLSTLRSHESGKSTLPRLVEDLEELLLSLSDENTAWQVEFRAARSALPAGRGDNAGVESMTNGAVRRLIELVEREITRREREQPGA